MIVKYIGTNHRKKISKRNRQNGQINAYKQDIIDHGRKSEEKNGRIYYDRTMPSRDRKRTVLQRVRVA